MAEVLVVTSGKGGVGKTTSTAALGAALAQTGQNVVVVDFDVGLRNLDLVMGAERRVVYDLINVANGDVKLQQALIRDKRVDTLYLLAASKTREKVALAIRLRLEAEAGHREAIRQALSFLALPTNAPLGAKCLYRTVDAIWYAAGDKATDFSFYTKRALLAGVYSATVLYWLNDKSEESAATWSFLDRRIADVMKIYELRARLDRFAEQLPDPFRLFRRPAGR